MSNLKEVNDEGNGKKFFAQRCESCGELVVVRSDGVPMATH